MTKESIKYLIEIGASIKFDYKEEISAWYSELGITKSGNFFYILPWRIKFSDINEAIEYFCDKAFSPKNMGYIQNRLIRKAFVDDNTDYERPNKKLKQLFKEEAKLVEEEFKLLNVIVKEFPKPKEAVTAFKEIIKNDDINTIRQKIHDFHNKFSTLTPYINVSAYYDVKDSKSGFSSSFDYESITPACIKDYKESYNDDKTLFKYFTISFKVDGDDEYYNFKINL
jgi:hypothetical protein